MIGHITNKTIASLFCFFTAGVVCGLALNASAPFPISPPQPFIETLSGPPIPSEVAREDRPWGKDSLLALVAHAFRWGIISVFPETVLLMLTPKDLFRFLKAPG